MTPEEGPQKFHTDDVSISKQGGASTYVWVVTRHQYGISALVSQTSFRGETSGSVANVGSFPRLSRIPVTLSPVKAFQGAWVQVSSAFLGN